MLALVALIALLVASLFGLQVAHADGHVEDPRLAISLADDSDNIVPPRRHN